jgi:hypothetical protein
VVHKTVISPALRSDPALPAGFGPMPQNLESRAALLLPCINLTAAKRAEKQTTEATPPTSRNISLFLSEYPTGNSPAPLFLSKQAFAIRLCC